MLRRAPRQATRARQQKGRVLHEATLRRQHISRRKTAADTRKGPSPLMWLAGKLCLWGGIMVLSGGLLVGGWMALNLSPAFAVRGARVEGVRQLSSLEVLTAAGVGLHTSLLSLKTWEVKDRVEKLGWVESAEVQRVWPRSVRIVVHENQPMALALVDGELFHLDGRLRHFAPLGEAPPPDVVVLTGLTQADLKDPDEEMNQLLEAARELMGQWNKGRLESAGRISEIHLDRVWGLSLVADGMPAVIRLGFRDFQGRLARLERILPDLRQRGELSRALLVDLVAERRTVVRLAGKSA